MVRNSLEIKPNCRDCLGVDRLLANLAVKQAAYWKIYRDYDRQSEAKASPEGVEYFTAEAEYLNFLELATFCLGEADNCFVDSISGD